MKCLQTRKRKLQEEIQKSLDEVVKEIRESRSVALLIRCFENSKNFRKNVLVSAATEMYLELSRASKMETFCGNS